MRVGHGDGRKAKKKAAGGNKRKWKETSKKRGSRDLAGRYSSYIGADLYFGNTPGPSLAA